MFLVFVYDTLSVVCHTDAYIVIFAIKMYIDFSFIRSVFEGIGQQVVHYFFILTGSKDMFRFSTSHMKQKLMVWSRAYS